MSKEEIQVQESTKDQSVENNKIPDGRIVPPNAGKELEQYKFADAVISCKRCGKDTYLEHPEFKNVEVGIQLPTLFATNQHFLALACSNCNKDGVEQITNDTVLTLRMVKAITPPAHSFNYEKAYEVPVDVELTWEAGEDVKEYILYLHDTSEDIEEGKEPTYKELGKTVESKFKLDLQEMTSYKLRIDTIYKEDNLIACKPIFLSTRPQPEESIPESTDNKETKE